MKNTFKKQLLRTIAIGLVAQVLISWMAACGKVGGSQQKNYCNLKCTKMVDAEDTLFHQCLNELCSQELWLARDCYDASGWMMIPMHYAFKSGDDKAVEYFKSFFENYIEWYQNGGKDEFEEYGRIDKLQFFYFCSEYLCLCIQYDYKDMYIPELAYTALSEAENILFKYPATWRVEPTVEEHLRQVLNGKEYEYSYYSWITDGDMYSLAIICDFIEIYNGMDQEVTDDMRKAANLAYEIFCDENLNTVNDDGGWLFQVGVFSDYPDYLYAGNTEISADMSENQRNDITWDVSHFQRVPLFLTSYENAQQTEEQKRLFRKRRDQLSSQLKKCIVFVDDSWRQTTFMDGTNGVYKYNKKTGRGICGYNNSAPFIQGWWSLTYDDRIFSIYDDILAGFPYKSSSTNPYWDNISTREQNPYFDCESGWDMGWYQCVVQCTVQLGKYK